MFTRTVGKIWTVLDSSLRNCVHQDFVLWLLLFVVLKGGWGDTTQLFLALYRIFIGNPGHVCEIRIRKRVSHI